MSGAGRRHAAGAFFDDYVATVFPDRRARAGEDWAWPGDEWVTDPVKEATFARIAAGLDLATCCHALEIGPGSGKYTELLLQRSPARVTACEVSEGFAGALRERCADAVAAGRLDVRQSAWRDNRSLLTRAGLAPASLDLVFGIDVFLMIDFQSVLVYLVSAAALLKPGGRFFGTFGDATSDSGWARQMRDLGRHSGFDDGPSTRFHWLSPEAIRFALERLGFSAVHIEHGSGNELDIARLYVGATMAAPMPYEEAIALLTPAGDSTNVAEPIATRHA